MNCRDFRDQLDAGRPAGEEMRRHADVCPDCAASWVAQRELNDALRQRFAVAPDGFADRLMERLPAQAPASSPARSPVPAPLADDENVWPWWLQLLTEPAALLGLALGGLYAFVAPQLVGLSAGAVPSLERLGAPWVGRIGAGLASLPTIEGWTIVGVLTVATTVALFRGSDVLFAHLARPDRR
jgi:hypothetical protein